MITHDIVNFRPPPRVPGAQSLNYLLGRVPPALLYSYEPNPSGLGPIAEKALTACFNELVVVTDHEALISGAEVSRAIVKLCHADRNVVPHRSDLFELTAVLTKDTRGWGPVFSDFRTAGS